MNKQELITYLAGREKRGVTVKQRIRNFQSTEHRVEEKHGVLRELHDTYVILSAPPIKGLSNNVSQQIGLSAIVAVKVGDDWIDVGEKETKSQEALRVLGARTYKNLYNAGYRHSASGNASLDNNRHSGLRGWAWEDGYMDYAGDRPKWHRAECQFDDHNDCPTI